MGKSMPFRIWKWRISQNFIVLANMAFHQGERSSILPLLVKSKARVLWSFYGTPSNFDICTIVPSYTLPDRFKASNLPIFCSRSCNMTVVFLLLVLIAFQMKFTQVKTGFMKKFEGCWRVEPLFVDAKSCHPFKPKTWEDYYSCTGGKGRVGSRVSLEQLIQPALVPPPPISWYLRGITAKTTEMLIHDLLAEAARIREEGTMNSEEKEDTAARIISNEFKGDKSCNVKERWAIHRRNAKQRPRRLVTEVK